MLKNSLALATVAALAACTPACADECDAVLVELSATISGLDVGERVKSTSGNVTVALKHPAADEIKLTCNPPGARNGNQIAAKWHSAYPPPTYLDLLASAGAIVTANSIAAVRKGALSCLKQALSADSENMPVELAGVHINCFVSTREGGRIAITVSSTRDERDLSEKMADPKNFTTKQSDK